MKLSKGYVHIYTGEGKGKTSAALGLAERAIGAGFKVCMIQFLKGGRGASGERAVKLKGFKIICCDQVHPMFCKKPEVRGLRKALLRDLEDARKKMLSKKYDVIILDEVINALSGGLLPVSKLIGFIKSRPNNVELVLTGRGRVKKLIALADYVTYFKKLKHPFDLQVRARKGIEF